MQGCEAGEHGSPVPIASLPSNPLPWQTLETRSAGFALAVFVHFFMAFLLGKWWVLGAR